MELSKRLTAIASFAPMGCAVADVGTDHGYVPIFLVKEGVAKRALAMDVRKGPLARAEEHIRAYQLEERVGTRLSDGLAQLKEGEADTVIIAGMGGGLMVRILEGRTHLNGCVHTYVLSPQSDWDRVRRFLRREGMRIVREEMIEEDGKFYPILLVKDDGEGCEGPCPGEGTALLDVYDRFGALLIGARHPVLMQYLARQEGQLREVEETLLEVGSEKAKARLEEIGRELTQIRLARELMEESR